MKRPYSKLRNNKSTKLFSRIEMDEHLFIEDFYIKPDLLNVVCNNLNYSEVVLKDFQNYIFVTSAVQEA